MVSAEKGKRSSGSSTSRWSIAGIERWRMVFSSAYDCHENDNRCGEEGPVHDSEPVAFPMPFSDFNSITQRLQSARPGASALSTSITHPPFGSRPLAGFIEREQQSDSYVVGTQVWTDERCSSHALCLGSSSTSEVGKKIGDTLSEYLISDINSLVFLLLLLLPLLLLRYLYSTHRSIFA